MTSRNPRPEELNQYSFPWATVVFAMGASGLLGAAVGEWVVTGRIWTKLLAVGLVWFAIAVYWLRRTARDEVRLSKQRMAREEDLVAAVVQTTGAETSIEPEASRPAP